MKFNTKRIILNAAGLMLTARNALADSQLTPSSPGDVIKNMGFLAPIAAFILNYSKWIAIFIAVISLVYIFVTGKLAQMNHKVGASIDAKEGLKRWVVELVFFIAALILLFSWAIPTINSLIPNA
jgi:hypothetical protein